jgi:hypothetical protein
VAGGGGAGRATGPGPHDLAARVAASVLSSGLREYYEPFTGAGMGQREFSWSAIVAEML